MKKIKIDETKVNGNEVIFPIEFNSEAFIIDSEEIVYSSKYKIDKNSISEKLEKVYAKSSSSMLEAIEDEYRDINLKERKFQLNKTYIMHNISHFDGSYGFYLFYFVREEDGVYAYYYSLLHSIDKYDYAECLNREELENIFKKDDLDGYYVVSCAFGFQSAFNKIDGLKEDNFTIPSDEKIVGDCNRKRRIVSNSLPFKTIDEIKNYNITGELFSNQFFLIKVLKGKIYAASFAIKMLEKNLFSCNFKIYNIGNFKDDSLAIDDESEIKLLLEGRKEI